MSETKIEIRGNLGKNPELRRSVKPCVKFPLAFNTVDENGQNKAIWYDVFSYVDIPEIMAGLKKGMSCRVIGTLTEKQLYRTKLRHITVKENDTDLIAFTRKPKKAWYDYD